MPWPPHRHTMELDMIHIYNIYENSFQSSGFISLCLIDPWRRPLSRSMSWDLIILRSQCKSPGVQPGTGPWGERKCIVDALIFPQGWLRRLLLEGPFLPCQSSLPVAAQLHHWSGLPECPCLSHGWGGRGYMTWSDESHSSEVLEASPAHAPTEPAGAAKTKRRGGRAQQVRMQAAAVPPAPVPGPRGLLPHPSDLLRMESTVFCAHYMFTWVKLQTLDWAGPGWENLHC